MVFRKVPMALGAEGFLVRAVPLLEKPDIFTGHCEDQRHLHIPKCLSQVQVRVLEGVIKNVEEFQFLSSLKIK